jgi:endoglucanase
MSVIHPKVKKWVKETASKNKIKLQFDIMSGGASDASVGPTIREGIPSGAITVPVRYIHTPVEVADMKIAENCIKLCVKLAETANKYF